MTPIHVLGLLVALCGLLLISFYATMVVSASLGRTWAVVIYLWLTLFLLDADFNGFVDESVNIDRLLRLLIGAGALAIGLVQLPKTYRLLTRPPALFLLLFALWALISTLYSVIPGYTFRSALMLFGLLLLAPAAARLLTPKLLLMTIAVSFGLFTTISWSISFATPELGRTPVQMFLGNEIQIVGRMNGLTSNPNILGTQVAAFLGILFLLYLYHYSRLHYLAVPAAVGLVTLAYTQSRTSLVALIITLMIFALRRWPRPRLPAAIAVFAGLTYFVLSPPATQVEMLEAFSRVGDSQEILTLTGRTDLWGFVLEKIEKSPWLGYGYASSP